MSRRIDIRDKVDPSIREILPLISFPQHPCLIKLVSFIYDKNQGIVLVLDFTSSGRINTTDFNKLCDDKQLKIHHRLLSCVAFLHEHGFIHRDICPSNVLISEDYETNVIDFGVSRFIDSDMTSDVGHPGYQSP